MLSPAIALADPCEAHLPRQAGQTFQGAVRYVGDGDSLCVGSSSNPDEWIEVRLADFNAPELHSPLGPQSKRLLEQIALGQHTTCTAVRGRNGRVVTYDRVIALCKIGNRSVGNLLRDQGAPQGGN